MDINELIAIVKKKLQDQINIESINIQDKSFLHTNHVGNQKGKFHLKVNLKSTELKKLSRIESNKKIYNNYAKNRMAIERMGLASEITNFVIFACSEYASFSVGSAFLVDGGQGKSFQQR